MAKKKMLLFVQTQNTHTYLQIKATFSLKLQREPYTMYIRYYMEWMYLSTKQRIRGRSLVYSQSTVSATRYRIV